LGHFGEVKAELEKRNLAPAAVAPVTEAAGASNQNSDNTDKREQARACWEVKFADGSVHSLSEEKEIVGAIMADEIKPDYECRRVTGLANAAKAQEIRWKRVSESLARSSFAIRTLFQPVWAHTVRGAEIGALMGLVFWFGSGVFVLIARAFALAPLNVNRSAAGFDYFVAAGLVYIF
ncbi:MAG TPA: hypothetical protein VN829_20155, partial [Dongiaceae bacterium]|nr:hypothetical protein [Dongiaceae bacterium]